MILFKEENHSYSLDGKKIDSVTQIMDAAGCSGIGWIPPRRLAKAAHFGQMVHKACHLDDLNQLDEERLDEQLKPFVAAWRQCKADCRIEVLESEKIVYSRKEWFAGTLDKMAKIGGGLGGTKAIVDLKTGSHSPVHGIQLSAYSFAVQETEDWQAEVLIACRLYIDGSGRPRYSLQPHEYDFEQFLNCKRIMEWKKLKGMIK